MKDIVLEMKEVTKKFNKRTIIDKLSLSIESGVIYGFLGENGVGKTTTIKMILHLISKDSGKIYINGIDIDVHYDEALKYVGAIVENPDLYSYLTGIENLKLFARIRGIDSKRIDEMVKLTNLGNRIYDKVKTYSLGMKQRLGIAVSLLSKPKLLILDEPTNRTRSCWNKRIKKRIN